MSRKAVTIFIIVASAIAALILVTTIIVVVIGAENEDNVLENKESAKEKQIDTPKYSENLDNSQNTIEATKDDQSKQTGTFLKFYKLRLFPPPQ